MRSDKSPFRFENMWLKVNVFNDLVSSWWMGYSIRGTYNYVLVMKIKALKQDPNKWNKEVLYKLLAKFLVKQAKKSGG